MLSPVVCMNAGRLLSAQTDIASATLCWPRKIPNSCHPQSPINRTFNVSPADVPAHHRSPLMCILHTEHVSLTNQWNDNFLWPPMRRPMFAARFFFFFERHPRTLRSSYRTQLNFATLSKVSQIWKWMSKIWGFLQKNAKAKTAHFRVIQRRLHKSANIYEKSARPYRQTRKVFKLYDGAHTLPKLWYKFAYKRPRLHLSFSHTLYIFLRFLSYTARRTWVNQTLPWAAVARFENARTKFGGSALLKLRTQNCLFLMV